MRTAAGKPWPYAHGGSLSRRDRLRLLGQVVASQLARIPHKLRLRLGVEDQASSRVDIGAIVVPDSAFALRTILHAKSLSPAWLFDHCQRTYFWGAAIAQARRIRHDAELLFAASLLHDLGLTEPHRYQDTSCACFAVEGARAAYQFACSNGCEGERADRIADAISLHLDVRVGLRHGAENHLLHAGAALDVVGRGLPLIGRPAVREVLNRYPRGEFKQRMVEEMQNEATRRPDSRTSFLIRLGFIDMIQSAPFTDS